MSCDADGTGSGAEAVAGVGDIVLVVCGRRGRG